MTNTTEIRTAADVRREHDEKAERIRFRLARELTQEQAQLVFEYGDAKECAAQSLSEEDELQRFEAFVRHFPGLAPAMRAIWQHVLDTHGGNSDECGLGAKPVGDAPCRDSAA